MRSHLPLPPLTYCSMYQSKDKFALTDFTKSRFGDQIQLKRKRNERLLRKRCLIHLAPNQSSHLTWFCIICFSFRFVIFLPSPGSLICMLSCYWSQFFFFFLQKIVKYDQFYNLETRNVFLLIAYDRPMKWAYWEIIQSLLSVYKPFNKELH